MKFIISTMRNPETPYTESAYGTILAKYNLHRELTPEWKPYMGDIWMYHLVIDINSLEELLKLQQDLGEQIVLENKEIRIVNCNIDFW